MSLQDIIKSSLAKSLVMEVFDSGRSVLITLSVMSLDKVFRQSFILSSIQAHLRNVIVLLKMKYLIKEYERFLHLTIFSTRTIHYYPHMPSWKFVPVPKKHALFALYRNRRIVWNSANRRWDESKVLYKALIETQLHSCHCFPSKMIKDLSLDLMLTAIDNYSESLAPMRALYDCQCSGNALQTFCHIISGKCVSMCFVHSLPVCCHPSHM